MTSSSPSRPGDAQRLLRTLPQLLESGKRVHLPLPFSPFDDGLLHVDRTLPFLCVYRRPENGPPPADDAGKLATCHHGATDNHTNSPNPPTGAANHSTDKGSELLVKGEAAYLIVSGAPEAHEFVQATVKKIVTTLCARFGGVLLLEIWAAPDKGNEADQLDPHSLKPAFFVAAQPSQPLAATLTTLKKGLAKCRLHGQWPDVTQRPADKPHPQLGGLTPPGMPPLLPVKFAARHKCHTIGLGVRPVYRGITDGEESEIFPRALRILRRLLGRALRRTFYTFSCTRTTHTAPHYHALGPRALNKTARDVDHRLSQVCESFDYLIQVSPVNAYSAWRAFQRSRFQKPPSFAYRPLPFEPSELKRTLFNIPLERVDDPALARLFREKQNELDRMITLVADCNTSRFLPESEQLFGVVSQELKNHALSVLETVPPRKGTRRGGSKVGPHALITAISEELAWYQHTSPDFPHTVQEREDVPGGILVSKGAVFVGHRSEVPAARVRALINHEVGVHVLTYYNGLHQPLKLLGHGLAAYEGFQEGLAVLSEYLAGGLSAERLRLLAARVLAVDCVVSGAQFIDTFRMLGRDYGFAQRVAYTIAMRVHRGGGLTKDALYLQGLLDVMSLLPSLPDRDFLFVGKMGARHLPVIRELLWRRMLKAPHALPRLLQDDKALEKLNKLSAETPLNALID